MHWPGPGGKCKRSCTDEAARCQHRSIQNNPPSSPPFMFSGLNRRRAEHGHLPLSYPVLHFAVVRHLLFPMVMPHSRKRRSRVCIGWQPVFITTKCPLGIDLNSSGVIRGRSTICRDWLGSFLLWLTEPDCTVRVPRFLDNTSAVWLPGAKPPKIVS